MSKRDKIPEGLKRGGMGEFSKDTNHKGGEQMNYFTLASQLKQKEKLKNGQNVLQKGGVDFHLSYNSGSQYLTIVVNPNSPQEKISISLNTNISNVYCTIGTKRVDLGDAKIQETLNLLFS